MMQKWSDEIGRLSEYAENDSHAAYTCYINSIQNKWNFLQRTCKLKNRNELYQALEEKIKDKFMKVLLKTDVSQEFRCISELPCGHGGLGIRNPIDLVANEYEASQHLCEPLKNMILNQRDTHDHRTTSNQIERRKHISRMKECYTKEKKSIILEKLNENM